MKLDIREGAVEDLKQTEDHVQKSIRDRIEELRNNSRGENTFLLVYSQPILDLLVEGSLCEEVTEKLIDSYHSGEQQW